MHAELLTSAPAAKMCSPGVLPPGAINLHLCAQLERPETGGAHGGGGVSVRVGLYPLRSQRLSELRPVPVLFYGMGTGFRFS